jgi:hypothetical protein
VVVAFPDIAQAATMEVARRNGIPDHGRGDMVGVLWRTSGRPVGGPDEFLDPSLPVVDPVLGSTFDQPRYMSVARGQRNSLARSYLNDLNRQAMLDFDHYAKMSQFGQLWRYFTCGHLTHLLEVEYRDSNMPHVMGTTVDEVIDGNQHLGRHFTFVGVVYWGKPPAMAPRVFRNPMGNDPIAYSEVRVFIPSRRLEWHRVGGGGGGPTGVAIGGVPGDFPTLLPPDPPSPGSGSNAVLWIVGREGVSVSWNLLNQRWTCQVVPATQPAIAQILQTVPPVAEFAGQGLTVPNLGGLTTEDLGRIGPH